MRTVYLLALLALPLAAQEEEGIVFGKQPIVCAPIECQVRVPNGWKVAQDHTGMSAEGGGMGFVITREPLLADEKTFGASWQTVLASAGKSVEVKKVRAGRYKAFFASWSAAGRKIAIYRIHVPDQEYLYNVSFSALSVAGGGDAAEYEALVEGVLKSFKCTSKKAKLALQQTRVRIGSAATIQLPEGFESKQHPRLRAGYFVRLRRGYSTKQEAGVIYLFATDPRRRPEDTNQQLIAQLGRLGMKFGNDFKSKDATYGGFKGAARIGSVTGTEGETYATYVWSGKKKRKGASVVLVIHEREMRLHKRYFTTVLKTLKATK